MKRIKLPPKIQKKLIEDYKKENKLSWKDLASKWNVGESTLRCAYRSGKLSIEIKLFNELTRKIENIDKEQLLRKGKLSIGKNYCSTNFKNSNRKKALSTLYSKKGSDFFSKIGAKGAKVTNKMWTFERRIRQSTNGRKGGNKKIKNLKYFTEQEKKVAVQNEKLNIDFKSNYFLFQEYNFDFVYFDNRKTICVEEVTLNPFRGFTYFLEKRNFLDSIYGKKFPLVVTINSSKRLRDLYAFLLKNRILLLNGLKSREKYIFRIFEEGASNKIINKLLFDFNQRKKLNTKNSKRCAYQEKIKQNKYEKFVHLTLDNLGFSPKGKEVFKSPFGSYYVSDDMFRINNQDIVVLVAECNSRGSLLYQLYKHATYSYIIKEISNVKVMSIIFDKSGTATALSNNVPKRLCEQYTDYYVVTFKKDDLAEKISKAVYGRVA